MPPTPTPDRLQTGLSFCPSLSRAFLLLLLPGCPAQAQEHERGGRPPGWLG